MIQTHQARVEKFLLLALRRSDKLDQELETEYKALGRDMVLKAATQNWIEPIIAHRLLSFSDLTNEDREIWKDFHDQQRAWTHVVFEWIRTLSQAFSEIGISNYIPLKDIGLSIVAYPCRYCRKAKDVDILVPKSSFKKLEALMASHGFRFDHEDPYGRPKNYLIQVGGQMEFTREVEGRILRVEFHHRPHAGNWIRPEQEPDASDLFDRAIDADLDGNNIKLLGYEDNLLHLCVHAAKHFFVLDKAIRMYVDIDRLIATKRIDWPVFLKMTKDYKVVLPVGIALKITRELLETDLPAVVLDTVTLASPRERVMLWWIYRMGIFEPSKHKLNRIQRFLFYGLLADSWCDTLKIIKNTLLPPLDHLKARYSFRSNIYAPMFYILNAFRILLLQRL